MAEPNGGARKGGAPRRVVVAGATGYLGSFVTREFKRRGYWVRILARSLDRLEKPGPFTAPAITRAHERVVADIEASGLGHAIVRPSGYFEELA